MTALAITKSLRATAVRITFGYLPRAVSRSRNAFRAGLCRTAESLSIVLTIKGRNEWREWLDARASEEGVLPTDLIDQSIACLAKAKKWGEVPSRT